jgi:hypothetical protein
MLIAAELEALARERFVSPPLTTAELKLAGGQPFHTT